MLLHGDNRLRLGEIADNSVDSIVTDPPYELGFMGKSWDASGVAYDVTVWQECLRVLKPGGHLLAFGGSRTYHRMACAIEDAGFQIRDQIMWVYGSGFPKSLNIGKAIDKAAGAEREVVGEGPYSARRPRAEVSAVNTYSDGVGDYASSLMTAPATAEAKEWDGWGTALKPAHEPIVMARKPLIGTVAENVLTYGVGGINIDGCRVISDDWDEKTVLGKYTGNNLGNDSVTGNFGVREIISTNTSSTLIGRFPANFIHDGSDEVIKLFPDKAGAMAPVKAGQKGFGGDIYGKYAQAGDDGATFYNDGLGSAARFFYCAKASKKDRNEGLDGLPVKTGKANKPAKLSDTNKTDTGSTLQYSNQNFHPTVKPTDLMRYLCRLVTPPNGTVLDPFLGSGSTAVAATLEGFNWVGCEMTADYLPIIAGRVKQAQKKSAQPPCI